MDTTTIKGICSDIEQLQLQRVRVRQAFDDVASNSDPNVLVEPICVSQGIRVYAPREEILKHMKNLIEDYTKEIEALFQRIRELVG